MSELIEGLVDEIGEDVPFLAVAVKDDVFKFWATGKKEYASTSFLTLVDLVCSCGGIVDSASPTFITAIENATRCCEPDYRDPLEHLSDELAAKVDDITHLVQTLRDGIPSLDAWVVMVEFLEEEEGEPTRLVEWSGGRGHRHFNIVQLFYALATHPPGTFTDVYIDRQIILSGTDKEEIKKALNM